MSSVQQLDPSYISKIDSRQLENLVNDGIIKKQGNEYYAVKGKLGLPDNCFVKDANNNVKTDMVDGKGTMVERKASQPKGEVVKTEKESVIPMERLVTDVLDFESGSADADDFISFIKDPENKFDLKFDEDGNINFGDMPKDKQSEMLQSAIDQYAEKHPEKFTTTQKNEVIFTENSDAEAIQKLENDGAIESKTDAESSGAYTVRDKQKLEKAVPKKINVSYEKTDPAQGNVDAAVTTTTTRKSNTLEVPEGVKLRDDKDARKQLEANAREVYSNMVADANEDDLQMRDAIDLYIAERKYNDKIEKRMAELSVKQGDGSAKDKRNASDIVQLYLDEYANEDDKTLFENSLNAKLESKKPEDKYEILSALNSMGVKFEGDLDNPANKEIKKRGAIVATSKSFGYDPETLLRLMATSDVMSERSSEQKLKDDQYFIKEQSKDFVRNQQAKQDIEDTEVHFSKSQRKNAPDDGRKHTDIGDAGRKMVDYCPQLLCDKIDEKAFIGHENDEENGYFKREIDGQTVYFQFSPDRWQALMGALCDPTTVTDEQMELLFGDDKAAKDKFVEDLNMTLQEGRSNIGNIQLPTDKQGYNGLISLQAILRGDGTKDNIRNRDLNKLRGMVESAGYSVDKNTTGGKRLLHVLKNAGIGYGIGLTTGGLGSLMTGALEYAGKTVAQTVAYSGKTDSQTVSGVTDGRIINDRTQFTYYDNGEKFTTTVDKAIYVEGQGYTVTVDGQEYSGAVVAEGQFYSGEVKDYWQTANYAGIVGATGGAVDGLLTMGKVEERGRNLDDIFNPIKYSLETNTDNESLSLKRPQYNKIEEREGSTEINIKVPTLNAKRFQGPAAYSILYQYEDGTEVKPRDFARAYQTKINGSMSNRYFYVYPELEVNGKKIIPVDDYETKYNLIPEGRDGGSTGVDLPEQSYTKKTILKATLK